MDETLTAASNMMGRRWESSNTLQKGAPTKQDPCDPDPTMWNVQSS